MRRLFGVFFILAFLLFTVSIEATDKLWTYQSSSTGRSNVSAPGSSFKCFECTLTVAAQETIWVEAIEIIDYGYFSLVPIASGDSVDVILKYKTSAIDSTDIWFKCSLDSLTAISDTVSCTSHAVNPAVNQFLKLMTYGKTDNGADKTFLRYIFRMWN